MESKIVIMNQEEITDNVTGQKFVGDFLELWSNIDQVDNYSQVSDFFPVERKDLGMV